MRSCSKFITHHRTETKPKPQPRKFPSFDSPWSKQTLLNQLFSFLCRVLFIGKAKMGLAQNNNFVHDFHEKNVWRKTSKNKQLLKLFLWNKTWQRGLRTQSYIYAESTTVSLETGWAVMQMTLVSRNLNQRINERENNGLIGIEVHSVIINNKNKFENRVTW